VRIYELARELGVDNKVLIDFLSGMGYPVKSHSSSIDYHLADRLRKQVQTRGLEGSKSRRKKKPAEPKAAPAKKPAKAAAKPAAKPAKKAAVVKKARPATGKAALKKPPRPPVSAVKELQEEKKEKAAPAKKVMKKPAEPVVKPAAREPEKKPKPAARAVPLEEEREKRAEEEKRKREKEATRRAEEDKRRKEREARRKEEDKKKLEAEAKRRKENAARKAEQEKKRRETEAKRKEEDKRRREEREQLRKAKEEERELQRLIDEEERARFEAEARKIVIDEATTVKEFAEKLRLGVNEIIKKLIGKGIMATLNQTIDAEVARELATELGYEIKTREEKETEVEIDEEEDKDALAPRPPVVTIMGHVDHGKTSLLDTIRKTSVTEEEAGGITQRIGAYAAKLPRGTVTFIDTPGHEAFTAMRARGASVTDIVVLVVAADDGVMPQTLEAIHHARAAGVPVVVAVNKMDKPDANPDRIKQDLAANDLVPEEWGGKTIFCEVSAKQNIGTDNLLEMLLLQAEILELKANPDRPAFGTVVESRLDKGRGPVATVLVQKGTLRVGDVFVSGVHNGKVRAIFDDQGRRIDSAGPSIPAEVLGFSGVPVAGESFMVVESERKAHQIALKREEQQRIEGLTAKGHVKLENLHAQITRGEMKDLNIIIKADVQGSIEAVRKALDDIQMENIRVNILHGAVGGITETDVSLAAASNAIIIGFNVRPTEKAALLAEDEEVDVRLYSIIYQAIDDIRQALAGMLEPVYREVITGRAEVRQTFHISKVGAVAGCMVTSGKITRNSQARLIRDSVVIYTGKIESLRRFKDDAKEVASGYECGIGLEKYSDAKTQDIIETFEMEELKKTP